jgi:type I restriction enzyme S subunit
MDWETEDGTIHKNCAVFHKVKEQHGGLSNMAGGFVLRVNGAEVMSAEALYQACRFPQQPDWQREIIGRASPMAAKMASRKDGRRAQSRPDWDALSVEVMRWVLRVKLAQHFGRLSALLEATADRPIVERSHKDRFWGAVEEADGRLLGRNQLGRLLLELRQLVRTEGRAALLTVAPPAIPNFLLLGEPIGVVVGR